MKGDTFLLGRNIQSSMEMREMQIKSWLVGKHFRAQLSERLGVSATPAVEENASLKPTKGFNFKLTSMKELQYASIVRGIAK